MTEMDIKRVLFGTKHLLGKEGQNWYKNPTAKTKYSIISALKASAQYLHLNPEIVPVTYSYLGRTIKDLHYDFAGPTMFEHDPKTTFDNVSEVLEISMNQIH